MKLFSNVKIFLRKAWLKISPTAHYLLRIENYLNKLSEDLQCSNIQREEDLKSVVDHVNSEIEDKIRGVAKYTDLLKKIDVENIIKDSIKINELPSRIEIENILQEKKL